MTSMVVNVRRVIDIRGARGHRVKGVRSLYGRLYSRGGVMLAIYGYHCRLFVK